MGRIDPDTADLPEDYDIATATTAGDDGPPPPPPTDDTYNQYQQPPQNYHQPPPPSPPQPQQLPPAQYPHPSNLPQPVQFPPPSPQMAGQTRSYLPPQGAPQTYLNPQPQAYPPMQPLKYPPAAAGGCNQPQQYPPAAAVVYNQQPQQYQPAAAVVYNQQPQQYPPAAAVVYNQQPQQFYPSPAGQYEAKPAAAPVGGIPIATQYLPPTENWRTGFLDCMDDPLNAIITVLFPCVTFGQIAEVIDNGQTSCATSGCIYFCIAAWIGVPCIISCAYRSKMRSQYGLIESPAPDCLTHCLCEPCALCQEYRELKLRGVDPDIGWHGNLARNNMQMQQSTMMAPPVNQTMMG